jgi:phosphohistidine phosphatase
MRYLVQHGEALPKDVDPGRPLSEQGRRDMERLGEWMAEAGLRVPWILHSGKTRARETAEILAQALGIPDRISAHGGLNPRDPPEAMAAELPSLADGSMIVGHLPHLGRLASLLLTGQDASGLLAFAPGTLVCLQGDQDRWSLVCMLSPERIPQCD